MIRRGAILAFFALAAARVFGAPAPGADSRPPKGIETADLDRSVDPCADFYEFANGAWRRANPIPASKPKWSRRAAARETNRVRVQELLEETARRKDWPKGSLEQIVGDHYASCRDEARVDAVGLAPLASLLAEIDAAQSPADVQRLVRKLHEVAVPVPFGVVASPDTHEPVNTIANVVAGAPGMPDRDDYLKPEPRFVEARETYRAHVAAMLKLGGMPGARAREAAVAVFGLEKRLAEASLDASAAGDPAKTDHRMTFAELEEVAPHVDWRAYFDEAHLPRLDLNVSEPAFVRQMDKELAETPVETWKAYLEWRLLQSAAPWLSRPFVLESFSGNVSRIPPRAARCAESTESLFGEAVGRMYAARYFRPAARAKAQEIVANLRAALAEEVRSVDWMTAGTKKTALEKIVRLDVEVGYPDRLKDHSAVIVRRDAFLANVLAGRKFGVDEERRLIGKPSRRDLWPLPPSSPDAIIDLQLDRVVLPAGFLQPPYFDPEATDAVNYGAFGIGLAHDLTHFVDTLGAENDVEGRPRNWWTDADRKEFEKRGLCVAEQYEGYFVEPGVHHDGRRVLGEAIGDLGGVVVAYRALEKSMESRPVPSVDGFTPEQQFFISWGQTTGAAMRLEAQRELVATDPHPVPRFRVIGPFSNVPEFGRAFSCRAGAAMVRPPEKRCSVW
jgi:endothelin-converting enzyme/putative endopeptidase